MRTTTALRPALAAAFSLLCLSFGVHAQPGAPEAAVELERRIATLEAETAATEAVRAVKRLQHGG